MIERHPTHIDFRDPKGEGVPPRADDAPMPSATRPVRRPHLLDDSAPSPPLCGNMGFLHIPPKRSIPGAGRQRVMVCDRFFVSSTKPSGDHPLHSCTTGIRSGLPKASHRQPRGARTTRVIGPRAFRRPDGGPRQPIPGSPPRRSRGPGSEGTRLFTAPRAPAGSPVGSPGR